jgi:5'-AMP-activated protein kinase catalytic alpha subunit
MKRATVEDIRKHEWFLEGAGCPTYLFPDRVTDTSIVDTDAIAEVSQKFGVEESEIHSALLSDDPHNALVIAYNLVIDNRRIESAKEKEDLKEFYSSAAGGGASAPAPAEGSGHKPHPERIAPLRDKPVTPVEKTHRGAPIKRSKWHLGIRSQVSAVSWHPACPPLPPVQAARHHERGLQGHEAARL